MKKARFFAACLTQQDGAKMNNCCNSPLLAPSSNSLRLKGFQPIDAMKICYRGGELRGALAQNDTAIGTTDLTLTHRIPVSLTVTACFEAELHEHRLQLDH
ncbi:MAG: hypothetical protein ACK5QW_01290, partial [Cyanobacteriota bacterium]